MAVDFKESGCHGDASLNYEDDQPCCRPFGIAGIVGDHWNKGLFGGIMNQASLKDWADMQHVQTPAQPQIETLHPKHLAVFQAQSGSF